MATTSGATHKAPAISQSEAGQAVIDVPTVNDSEIINNISFYIKLCEEQSVVFQQNVEEFTREYNLYTQSADVMKPGQNHDWKPAPCNRDAFVAEMKRRCQEVPNSIADRIKIFYAAHAILACTVFVDMAQHPQEALGEILAKANKKSHEDLMHAGLMPPPTIQTLPSVNILMQSNPNPPKRLLTAEDYTLFAGDPTTLPDKQFLLDEGEGCNSLYEVTEVRFLKGSWVYLVRFEGCHDCVTMPGQVMMEMLQRSSLVEGK